jgi:defect-in-organelle-trafficking protein DotD
MNTNRLILLSLVPFSILGCSSNTLKNNSETAASAIERNIESSIKQIELVQADLYQHAAINDTKTGITGGIYHDSQQVTMKWNGDANTLLKQLAYQRGFKFVSTGVQLPLPININVNNMPYNTVIERIQTQIGYRAGIIIDNSRREMLLSYTSPTAKPNDGRAFVVRPSSEPVSPRPFAKAPSALPKAVSIAPAPAPAAAPLRKISDPKSAPSTGVECVQVCTSEEKPSTSFLKSKVASSKPLECVQVCSLTDTATSFSSSSDKHQGLFDSSKITFPVQNAKCSITGEISRSQTGTPLVCRNKWIKLK